MMPILYLILFLTFVSIVNLFLFLHSKRKNKITQSNIILTNDKDYKYITNKDDFLITTEELRNYIDKQKHKLIITNLTRDVIKELTDFVAEHRETKQQRTTKE